MENIISRNEVWVVQKKSPSLLVFSSLSHELIRSYSAHQSPISSLSLLTENAEEGKDGGEGKVKKGEEGKKEEVRRKESGEKKISWGKETKIESKEKNQETGDRERMKMNGNGEGSEEKKEENEGSEEKKEESGGSEEKKEETEESEEKKEETEGSEEKKEEKTEEESREKIKESEKEENRTNQDIQDVSQQQTSCYVVSCSLDGVVILWNGMNGSLVLKTETSMSIRSSSLLHVSHENGLGIGLWIGERGKQISFWTFWLCCFLESDGEREREKSVVRKKFWRNSLAIREKQFGKTELFPSDEYDEVWFFLCVFLCYVSFFN